MSAWEYERISAARDAWAEAKLRYPPPTKGDGKNPKPKPHAIRTDGSGPQF